MDLSPRRRRALSTVLAFVLAIESVSAVAAAASVAVADDPGQAAPVAPVAVRDTTGHDPEPAAATNRATTAGVARARRPDPSTDAPATATPSGSSRAGASRPNASAARATTDRSRGSGTARTVRYHGRNHVWIPSMGIDRSVAWFPCTRKRPPDNLVYRWGCAGSNNVYLLGHAYSVFKPLHDSYVRGRLRAGLRAYYADARGKVHTYRVTWWKVTAPTTSASWAWAPQHKPSMTLQTCVGNNSAYRLMVRLVEVRR